MTEHIPPRPPLKPVLDDWSDAPEWATCLVTDENGDRYWFENEPVADKHEWLNQVSGQVQIAYRNPGWNHSLVRRPEPRPMISLKDSHPEFVHLLGEMIHLDND